MSTAVQTGEISTKVPARLDRLPWAKFHWMIVVGLGGVWILDGLEVTMVGSVAPAMTEKGSGIAIGAAQIGLAGSIYIIGACLGALFFGQMTDRYGRKKLFLITLGLYILATVATGFSLSVWWFFAARFFTGAGIGGEYAAINSAIDELIPARVRGRVDLAINGSYWVGSAAGAAAALLLLNMVASDWGWRLAFFVGAVLGVLILVVRRHVPESPRWLFIHGHQEDAERIVDDIERAIREETGQDLAEPRNSLTVRQRKAIPFREIARVAFSTYPKRAILGFALFVGQAFIYNGVTFDLGTLYQGFFGISSAMVPLFIIIWALGNFAGPVLLGRMFDTVGRKPMISGTYIGSAVVTVVLALVFVNEVGGPWLFLAILVVAFFLASAGASAAYLTVSEIFPMETRALAIAFFYAIGTAVGGISGPLLFGRFIDSGDRGLVSIAFYIGAAVMALGGVVEIMYGVKAERAQLEDIAMPLTAQDAEDGAEDGAEGGAENGEEGGAEGGAEGSAEDQERKDRIAARGQRHRDRALQASSGLRRYRPGPGRVSASWLSTTPAEANEEELDHEIDAIVNAVADRGPMDLRELRRTVAARYWGPGRFGPAVREAVEEGRIVRVARGKVGPPQS